nr:B12-binding domain-containing radical SAM protein [uncultured Eisenbergiella sp.]
MKFLLAAVNAKYIHSNPAIYSLRAYSVQKDSELEKHIELAEYTINQPFQDILADIYARMPDCVAFSCYIWNIGMVKDIVRELAKILPETRIWLGGPEVSYNAEELLEEMPFLTGIMVGEGEVTFHELLMFYRQGCPEDNGGLEQTDGIVFRKRGQGGICRTGDRALTDISSIPFFYDDADIGDFHNRILYYESSRGCPYRCSYCLSSIDKTVRLRSLNLVEKELQFFLEKKVPQVKFVDRTFNCNHSHAMGIWRFIKEQDNGITNFHFEISADILTEEEITLLQSLRPGLVQLEIGVQSTNPVTIREIRRHMDWERLRRIVAALQEKDNIHIHLDLIAGLPYEDFHSFRNSFNEVYACRPEQLQLGFLKVLKGSYMYEKASEYEIHYTDKPPYEVLFTKWLPYSQVLKLKRVEEMVELYYNSSQFAHTLPVLEKAFPDPFRLYEQLAEYYEEKGYFVNNPARAYRYQVLLDFALSADPDNMTLYRQLLTLDMYLRENMKSRPAFVLPLREQQEAKDKINGFYRREECSPSFLKEYVEDGYNARQMARMTHIECFTFPVWEKENPQGNGGGAVYYLLFDYRKRNPLNQEAYTMLLPLA